MGLFGAAHGCVGQKGCLPKICHTYPTVLKLGTVIPYQRCSKKCMNHGTHLLNSADISSFQRKSANLAIS